MSDIDLPDELTTKAEVEKIQVPVDMVVDRTYTPEQMDQLAKNNGFLIDFSKMRALQAIGLTAEQLGALRQYKGGVIVTLAGVLSALGKCTAIMEDESDKYGLKDKLDVAKVIGYLANSVSKVTTGAVKMDRDVAEVVMERDRRTRQSFQPGQCVTLNKADSPTSK
jgi:hypothetical protein